MSILSTVKQKASAMKKSTMTVYFAVKDPRTPWFAKLFAGMVLAYAFSPIDLIPDFIPVFGLLDDLLIVPVGLAISIKMIPLVILESAKQKAAQSCDKPVNYWVGAIIAIIWVMSAALILKVVFFN